jgi:hypothetical protein
VDHLLVDQRATVFGMKAASFRLGAVLLPVLLLILPLARLHAEEVLLTFGDMLRLRELPVESAKRALTPEELVLYQDYESYAYTPFEALQVANNTAELLNGLEEGCTRKPAAEAFGASKPSASSCGMGQVAAAGLRNRGSARQVANNHPQPRYGEDSPAVTDREFSWLR